MRIAVTTLALVVALGGVHAVWARSDDQAAAQTRPEQRSLLKIEGMTCGGCAVAVKLAANSVAGVTDCKVSYEKGTAEVTYDASKTNPEAIATVISDKSGFKATAPKKPTS